MGLNESVAAISFSRSPRKSKDWAAQVIKDMEKFEITLAYDDIRKMPEDSWKSFVKRIFFKNAVEYLNFNQGRRSQKSESLMMAPFLSSDDNEFSLQTSSFIAKIQTRMIENIKYNFKEYYKPNLVCNSCNLYKCDKKKIAKMFKLDWKQ